MGTLHSEGGNFRIEIDGDVAVCRVFQTPSASWEEGARNAEQMNAALRSLLDRGAVTSLLFDISNAPPVVGPITERALSDLFAAWERSGRRVLVAGTPQAVMSLQFTRILATHAPLHGAYFDGVDAARASLL